MEETIIKEWLKSLCMEQYAESFMDNGYDDLEICKQIDAPDLDAIGVVDPTHRSQIIQAVQVLKVEGAASVYFTVEEAQAATQDNISRSTDPSSIKEGSVKHGAGSSAASTPGERPQMSLGMTTGDMDAYEAGRAELVRLPQLQLRKLIHENLIKDNVNLTLHPYTNKEGERGILEGLASRYADQFNTHFQDVLEHLEYVRSQEWNKVLTSSRLRNIPPPHNLLYQSKGESVEPRLGPWSPRSSSSSSLDHYDDYPIYVPGKYNPSSCLSDAEEDQIYGFAGGTNAVAPSGPGYLNPRSQCIYELPPSRRSHGGVKKKLGLGRLLKTLRRDLRRTTETSRHKTSVTHTVNPSCRPICAVPDLSSTPLVVLPGYSSPTSSQCSQSSRSHSSGQSFIVTSASAPGTPGSSGPVRDSGLQQAIERLKEQEIKRRREEQFKEHEQILHDIQHGLKQSQNKQCVGSFYAPFPMCNESSYMYDDDVISDEERRRQDMAASPNPLLLHHWYDEPPYESDPEDFLIGINKDGVRDFIPNNVRLSRDEDVISLKTAGDITLPRDILTQSSEWSSPRHYMVASGRTGVIVHNGQFKQSQFQEQRLPLFQEQRNYLQMDMVRSETIARGETMMEAAGTATAGQRVPSRVSERGTAGPKAQEIPFDLQSISSKLSNMSVDTNRSETLQPLNRRVGHSSGSEETHSGSPSDYEEEEERRDSESLVGRMRLLQRDMQRKISCLKNCRDNASVEATSNGLHPSANEERLRERLEAGYVRYHRQNSLPVKLKQMDTRAQHHSSENNDCPMGPIVGRTRALVDYQPSPYDKEALKFKKGDIIDVISKSPSGIWRGHLNGKVGHFKFILVEEIENAATRLAPRSTRRYGITQEEQLWFQKPGGLRDLLVKFNLSHLTQLLLLNGYETVGHFREIGTEDLDHLGIIDPEIRSRILCAVRFLLNSMEEYENTSLHWVRNSTFVRHVNGRVSLPVKSTQSTFYPSSHIAEYERGGQIYENTTGLLYPPNDENNLDHLERLDPSSVALDHSAHSSSSTDTSSGYHSRPTFNIPLATATDTPSSPSPGLQGHPKKGQGVGVISPTNGEPANAPESHNRDSYHAQVARVQSSPSPPLQTGRQEGQLQIATSC